MNKPDFLVSIHCMTYNHAPYIEDAMKGFCMQETTFPYVAIIVDDASTDGEPEVIISYLNAHFDMAQARQWETDDARFFYAQHIENNNCYFAVVLLKYNFWQAKKGKEPLIQEWTDTKYVALCEGDDYWTDEKKLQRQLSFLKLHPDYELIAENALVINTIDNTKCIFNNEESRDYSLAELVQKRRFATASVVCKNYLFDEKWKKMPSKHDTMLWCYLASKGKIRYNNIISSVYLRGRQGITEYTPPFEWAKIVEKWSIAIYKEYGDLINKDVLKEKIFFEYNRAFFFFLSNHMISSSLWVSFWKCISIHPKKMLNDCIHFFRNYIFCRL